MAVAQKRMELRLTRLSGSVLRRWLGGLGIEAGSERDFKLFLPLIGLERRVDERREELTVATASLSFSPLPMTDAVVYTNILLCIILID